ncbi:ATP-binding cassette domain-containing protein [Nocardia sp. NPDC051900]|uniref:ATP-binding cassette domain-containing protein n=1 Tax=Nocardia sp. NPDC051900 TaxID=3364326 RepID=UPI0037BB5DB2
MNFSKNRRAIGLGILCSALTTALLLAQPFLVNMVIDAAGAGGGLSIALACLFIAGFTLSVLGGLRKYIFDMAGESGAADLRRKLIDTVAGGETRQVEELHKGAVVSSLISDVGLVKPLFAASHSTILFSSLVLAAVVVVLLCLDWVTVTVGILLSFGAIFFAMLVGRRIARGRTEVQAETAELSTLLTRALSNFRILTSTHSTQQYFGAVHEQNDTLLISSKNFSRRVAMVSPIGDALLQMAFVSVAVVGGVRVGSGVVSLAEYVTLLMYFGYLTPYSSAIVRSIIQLNEGRAAWDRIDEMVGSVGQRGGVAASDARLPGALENRPIGVAATDICFAISGHRVLKSVSVDIAAGSHVAVIGPSGAGKTTLVNILAGLEGDAPGMGNIVWHADGYGNIEFQHLPLLVMAVSQGSVTIPGRVKENLMLGSPCADESQVIAAARAVGLCGAGRRSVDMDRVLSDSNTNLSGGEKQRVAIARAILRRPALLIMDEAMSNLDMASEKQILVRIRALLPNSTIIAVTHRLSTLDFYDSVIELRDGELVRERAQVVR